jgi:CheY-like chemotaxis protein
MRVLVVDDDLHMPVMGGRETARALRELDSGKERRLWILALSGGDDDISLREAGFDGYVQKPVDADTLKEVLLRWEKGTGWWTI